MQLSMRLTIFGFCFISAYTETACQCTIPEQFQGDWFSMERGADVNTLINDVTYKNSFFEGTCNQRVDINNTLDANGRHDSLLLFYSAEADCYKCFHMLYRTVNIVQYKQSECRSAMGPNPPALEDVCNVIGIHTEMWTFFRKTVETVNCKNTFEGVFQFSYEWDVGGGGICDSSDSVLIACQEPGSPYVDNEVFNMKFARCQDVQSSANLEIKFQCMGTWEDQYHNIWSAVADLGADVYRERFRCLLTRYDQEEGNNKIRYTMSWWADCSTLKSPYEGPIRLLMQPVVGGFQLTYTQPKCNFPSDFAGSWYHTTEYDVYVNINATHIYFNTVYDLYTYKETYFVCIMHTDTRYLTLAITVGKCEIDYVCFEMLARHHSVIRWRIGRPSRLTEIEMAYPDPDMWMFRQACTWNSFTIDRDNFAWNYKTLLLNPPVPINCPIRGRFKFSQKGLPTEIIRTRIRGITERPRHKIDCKEYTSEWKSCDDNPTKILIDAEYCETVDHTGRPIGEYDMPDWELTCIGHWDEDWNSYLITWDPEDAMSAYRCWIYERLDWRVIQISRSTSGACAMTQSTLSWHPDEGASLAIVLEENERQYDDCAQIYIDGSPWESPVDNVVYGFSNSGNPSFVISELTLLPAFCLALLNLDTE